MTSVRSLAIVLASSLSACSSLLPSTETATQTPWQSFAEAQRTFERIVPYQTTAKDLQQNSLDPYQNPNVAILSYADLMRRLLPNGIVATEYLDPGLRDCLMVQEQCSALELDQKQIERRRSGNFWLDFFNFRRIVTLSGWRYNAIIVLKQDLVVYKLWSGQPAIHETEDNINPLGPLQGLGESGARLPR